MDGGSPPGPSTSLPPPVRFHRDPQGRTADHVYGGAAGMFVLDDDSSRDLDLQLWRGRRTAYRS